MTISLNKATQIFNSNPQVTKWIPEQNFNNAVVKFEKDNDIIKKVVTRKDGTEVTGYYRNGNLFQTILENLKGKITVEIDRPVQKELPAKWQFSKSTSIETADGDRFTRYEDKTNGIKDIWSPKNSLVRQGKMNALYNEFLSRVKN